MMIAVGDKHFIASDYSVKLRPKHKKAPARESKPADIDDRRIEPDRRNFSYTYHIPERRSGTERRRK